MTSYVVSGSPSGDPHVASFVLEGRDPYEDGVSGDDEAEIEANAEKAAEQDWANLKLAAWSRNNCEKLGDALLSALSWGEETERENAKLWRARQAAHERNKRMGGEMAKLIADKELLAQELANCSKEVLRLRAALSPERKEKT